MGLQIKNNSPAANYSGTGLGQYVNQATQLANAFIANGGITAAKQQTAIRNFYTAFIGKGLYGLFSTAHIMGFGGSLPDSLDLLNPILAAPYRATFVADLAGAHTSQGFQGDNTTGRYLDTKMPFPAGVIANFHCHAFNRTADGAISSPWHMMGGNGGGAAGAAGDWKFLMGRSYIGRTAAYFGNSAGMVGNQTSTSYDTTKTGLLSYSFQGGSAHKIYDAAVSIVTQTSAVSVIGGGLSTVNKFTGGGALISPSFLSFVGVGFTAWSDQNEVDLNTIVNSFIADMA